MKTFIKILLQLCFPLLLIASNNDIKFEHLTINDGLSQNTVICTIQDKKGFLWIATQDGLNKYDGHNFTIYKKGFEGNKKLSSGWIEEIIEDHKGNLLLATRLGLDIINTSSEKITYYQHRATDTKSISNEHATAIIECSYDSVYEVWIGTVDGLNLFNEKSQNFEIFRNIPKDSTSLSNNHIRSFYQDKNQNFWIGTNYGLNLYNREKHTFTQFISNSNSSEENQINEITEDENGNLLIGSENNMYIFLTGSKTFIPYNLHLNINSTKLANKSIHSILNDNNEKYWIGTSNGLFIIDLNSKALLKYSLDNHNVHSLSANSIFDIFKDKNGSYWIGTYSGGVSIYHSTRKQFINIRNNSQVANSLNNNDVLSIYEDKNNILWIGTHGGGINRFDRTNYNFTHYKHDPKNSNSLPHDYVRCITEDKSGNLWFGTDGGGISIFNRQSNTFTNYKHIPGNTNSLSNNKIRAIKEDNEGIIWIGTSGGGLNKFDVKTGLFTRYNYNQEGIDVINNNYIYNILIDKSNNLWIGSDGDGLILFDRINEKFTSFTNDPENPNSLCNNFVLCIHEAPDGIIWVGTDIGLTKYNKKENKFYTQIEKISLPNTMIYGILEDNSNNLWLSTNEGIIRFNYSNGSMNQYDVKDGIQSNEFWGNSYYKSTKGEFFFGGINGLTTFFPDSVGQGYRVPTAYITGLSINNNPVNIGEEYSGRVILEKSIVETEEIFFNHLDRSFSIDYVAPNYINPEKIQYAYKMEGFDLDWHYAGNNRFANYTNLPAGKYIFKVRTSNGEGQWNEKISSLRIRMLPPFWKTWWFISSVLITIIGSIFFWYWNRLNQIKVQKIILEETVRKRTAEILRQKEEIENKNKILESQKKELAAQRDALITANNTKDKFFSIISHDLKSPFNALLGFSEIMTENLSSLSKEKIEKYIERIFLSAKQLYNLVENLLSWSRAKMGRISSYPERLNLHQLLESTVSLSRISTEKKQIEISLAINSNHFIYGDENLISTTVRNLLSNATKYSKENSTIEITSKQKNKFIEVSVSDTGVGIKKEDLKKLFREDVHHTTLGTQDEQGTGLGLILCREFVEQIGGEIWVESKIGKGTTFTFSIPIANEE